MSGSVLLDTTAGPIAIELYWQHAPNACRNFWELANRSYYDGTVFHRVIKDFMIQVRHAGFSWCVAFVDTDTLQQRVAIRLDQERAANRSLARPLTTSCTRT